MKSITFVILSLFALGSNASLMVGDPCPIRFVGEVKSVDAPSAPVHSLSRHTVHFTTIDVQSGDVPDEMSIQALVNGTTTFEKGHRYLVEMRGIYLCSVSEQN